MILSAEQREKSAHFFLATCHGSKFNLPPPLLPQVSWCRDGVKGIVDKASWRIGLGKGWLGMGGGFTASVHMAGGSKQMWKAWCMQPLLLPVFIVPAQFTGCLQRRCDEHAFCCEASEAHVCTQGRWMPVTTTIQTKLAKLEKKLCSPEYPVKQHCAFCYNTGPWARATDTLTTENTVYVSCWSEQRWITHSCKYLFISVGLICAH